jgi:hypothetical protein
VAGGVTHILQCYATYVTVWGWHGFLSLSDGGMALL